MVSDNCIIDMTAWPFGGTAQTYVQCGRCGGWHMAGMTCACYSLWTWTVPVPAQEAVSGWACPKCGSVWGPSVKGCERCNGG